MESRHELVRAPLHHHQRHHGRADGDRADARVSESGHAVGGMGAAYEPTDALVFEVAGETVELASERIRAAMVAAAKLRVPLEVDVGVGANWDEAH